MGQAGRRLPRLRVPYGTAVTLRVLDEVDRAESGLCRLGLPEALRVRHHGDIARSSSRWTSSTAPARRDDVVAAVRAAGYRYVTLDLEGLRSGNLNRPARRRESTRGPGSRRPKPRSEDPEAPCWRQRGAALADAVEAPSRAGSSAACATS